jgi:hypothetical protein
VRADDGRADDATAAFATDLLVERLLRVIDEGRRTATYKLALLVSLIDAVALTAGSDTIATRLIAERVLALYYPQTRIYVANDGIARELRQISMKSSPVLRAVLRLRLAGDRAGCRSVEEARARVADVYLKVLADVEATFVRYPIPLLQVVGTTVVPFLYAVDWEEGTSITRLRAEGRDHVRLLPGVADRLIVLGPMLRPLIELHWARDVARWSRVTLEDEALHAHLFGVERVAFPTALVSGLRHMQDGRCFYCLEPVEGRGHVDHFLPWSRWPNDAIENLVLADRCNLAKRDHLVGDAHLRRWCERLDRNADDLRDAALAARWLTDPSRSLALVRSTYSHIAAGTPLWRHGTSFELATGPVQI